MIKMVLSILYLIIMTSLISTPLYAKKTSSSKSNSEKQQTEKHKKPTEIDDEISQYLDAPKDEKSDYIPSLAGYEEASKNIQKISSPVTPSTESKTCNTPETTTPDSSKTPGLQPEKIARAADGSI